MGDTLSDLVVKIGLDNKGFTSGMNDVMSMSSRVFSVLGGTVANDLEGY